MPTEPPKDWVEIDETEFRLLLDSMSWRRDGVDNFYNERTGELFAVRIRERIWVTPWEKT